MQKFFDNLLTFSGGADALSVEQLFLCLLSAFLLGQLLSWLYVWTHRGLTYSASISQALIVLSLVVSLVMLVVGNNIARAFGMFGALALIRFRTPVKDSWDTVFLFSSVAIGIATGTNNILAAAVGTVVICAVIAYLYLCGFGKVQTHNGLLRVRFPAGSDVRRRLESLLRGYCDRFHLIHMREVAVGEGEVRLLEHAYQLRLVDPRFGSELMSGVLAIEGARAPTLLMQDEEAQP